MTENIITCSRRGKKIPVTLDKKFGLHRHNRTLRQQLNSDSLLQ
jgi:hypothetical protein